MPRRNDDDGPVNTVFTTEDAVYTQKHIFFLILRQNLQRPAV
jgi:hypothetical protein